MHHAARIVEAFAIDRHARAAGILEDHHQLGDRDVLVDGLDVGARHHDVLDAYLAEAENVVQHRPLFGQEGRLAARLFRHQGLGEVLAQAGGARHAPKLGGAGP